MSEIPQPIGPDEHKAAARQLGVSRIGDLLALSRNNDPFFKGTPAHWSDGRWFASLWEHFGFGRGVHLRRVHYQAQAIGFPKPDGSPYLNNKRDWEYLLDAGASARILGLVDAEAFVDRRNDPPTINVWPRGKAPEPASRWVEDLSWSAPRWSVPRLNASALAWQSEYPMPEPAATGYDYQDGDQPTLVEVWIEKSTMNDVLEPLCLAQHVNLLAGRGFQSLTAAIQLLRRAQAHGRPAHVLYVSDFDPAGVVMPVSIARQAQFWGTRLGVDAELTLHPVALTREQVDAYQLPRVPVALDKNGRPDKRGHNFEAIHGEGVVELDALEALHPGTLREVVSHAIQPYVDRELPARLLRARAEAQEILDAAWWEATADLRQELAATQARVKATVDRYRERLQALAEELADDLEPHQQALDDLAARTAAAAEGFEVELPARPVADPPDVDRSGLLYDSTRGWTEQLEAFRAKREASP